MVISDMETEFPKVMLLMNGNPDGSGIGELFLNAMLSGYPRSRLVRFSTIPQNIPPSAIDWQGTPAYLRTAKTSSIPVYSSLLVRRYSGKAIAVLAEQVLAFIREHQVQVLWVALNHPAIIYLAHFLLPKLTVPMAALVWDVPEYLIGNLRLDPFTAREMVEKFGETIRGASAVATASSGMSDSFRERFGIESFPVLYSPPEEIWKPDKDFQGRGNGDGIRVIFSGSLYAWRVWGAFLNAVESRNHDRGSKPTEVVCLGSQSRFSGKRKWVTYQKPLSLREAIDSVHASDAAYLPYWLDSRHSYITRTSFPSKLVSYLAAGVPILFHGPENSTAARFIQKYPVGVCCSSTRPSDILHALDVCTKDREFLRHYPEARERARNEALSPDALPGKFRETVTRLVDMPVIGRI